MWEKMNERVDSFYPDNVTLKAENSQGWCWKSSDRGAGASNRGAKVAKTAVFVDQFAIFPLTRTQNIL